MNPNVLAGHKTRQSSVTGYKGVSYDKRRKLYRARITKNGVVSLIGWFKTAESAAIAYNRAAMQMYGADAFQNEIGDQ